MILIQQQAAPVTSTSTPDDRATAFKPLEGGTEMRSGGALLVAAYAILWVILMTYVIMLWRKQQRLHDRIDDLDKSIARAATAKKP